MDDTTPSFADQLGDILGTPTPTPSLAVTITLAALALGAGLSGMWVRYTTILSTLFHEAGHALAAVLTGGGVYTIRIESHESGVTHTWYRTPFSDFVSSFAGASTPPLLAVGIAYLVHEHKAAAALAIIAVAAACVLLVARDLLTLVVAGATAAGAGAVVWWASPWAQTLAATAVAWLFLVCEATHLIKEAGSRYLFGAYSAETDAEDLWEITRIIPPLLWYVAWLVLNGLCVWWALPLLGF